eukprot:5679652-Alexandrium_andersonii.AAC.1
MDTTGCGRHQSGLLGPLPGAGPRPGHGPPGLLHSCREPPGGPTTHHGRRWGLDHQPGRGRPWLGKGPRGRRG